MNAPLLTEAIPQLATELTTLLEQAGEAELAAQVPLASSIGVAAVTTFARLSTRLLRLRVAWVVSDAAERVTEDRERFAKRDAMPCEIVVCLTPIPFEPQPATFHAASSFARRSGDT